MRLVSGKVHVCTVLCSVSVWGVPKAEISLYDKVHCNILIKLLYHYRTRMCIYCTVRLTYPVAVHG